MHDLVIRNARIVDGSGGPGARGDVAIDGDRDRRGRARCPAAGRREIDADGALVTPGLRRHPHPLRRPGDLGPAAVARRAGTASPPSSWATAASASPRRAPTSASG